MGGNCQYLQESLPPETLSLALLRGLGQGDTLAFSQVVDGLREAQIFYQHHELEDVAPLLASKAIEDLLGLADGKGRGFFRVKGAESPVILTLFLQADISAHEIHDADTVADLINEVVVESHFLLAWGIIKLPPHYHQAQLDP